MNKGIKYDLKKVVNAKLTQLINRVKKEENEEGTKDRGHIKIESR